MVKQLFTAVGHVFEPTAQRRGARPAVGLQVAERLARLRLCFETGARPTGCLTTMTLSIGPALQVARGPARLDAHLAVVAEGLDTFILTSDPGDM